MTDRPLPVDQRPRMPWVLWLVVAIAAVVVIRIVLHAASRLFDIAATVVVVGAIAAIGWHIAVGGRRSRRRH